MSHVFAALGPFGDAIDFIFQQRESQAGTVQVGISGAGSVSATGVRNHVAPWKSCSLPFEGPRASEPQTG